MDIEYVDILAGEMLAVNLGFSFIGQFVYPVGGDGKYRYFSQLHVSLY